MNLTARPDTGASPPDQMNGINELFGPNISNQIQGGVRENIESCVYYRFGNLINFMLLNKDKVSIFCKI